MKVKNWEKFQHYKDRRPPWIKMYRELLDDPEFFALSGDAVKCLMMLWLVASEDEEMLGNLPAINVLAFRFRLTEPKLEKLILELSHWLILDASMTLAGCQHVAIPETETERESETETEHAPADGFDAFWSAYPKKAARKDALKAWGQTAKERPPIDVLLRAIRRQLQGRQWQDGIYSHAATWLRGERWLDEPERGGPMVGRPQPKMQVEVDDGPAATDEEKAAAFKQIRGKLGMNPFTAEGEG